MGLSRGGEHSRAALQGGLRVKGRVGEVHPRRVRDEGRGLIDPELPLLVAAPAPDAVVDEARAGVKEAADHLRDRREGNNF